MVPSIPRSRAVLLALTVLLAAGFASAAVAGVDRAAAHQSAWPAGDALHTEQRGLDAASSTGVQEDDEGEDSDGETDDSDDGGDGEADDEGDEGEDGTDGEDSDDGGEDSDDGTDRDGDEDAGEGDGGDDADEGDSVDVEFLNCSAVRISGDVPELELDAFTYVPALDTYVTTVGPFEGTRVVDVENVWDAKRGLVLGDVQSYLGEPRVTVENPNVASCAAEVRPGRPTASVASTERTGDGTVRVTFRYGNPNDAELRNYGDALDGRVTAGDAPLVLEPGTHTFTVEWSPASGSARLTWTLDLNGYGYDDPVTARTAPAGSIVSEPTTTTATTTTDTPTTTTPTTTTATTAATDTTATTDTSPTTTTATTAATDTTATSTTTTAPATPSTRSPAATTPSPSGGDSSAASDGSGGGESGVGSRSGSASTAGFSATRTTVASTSPAPESTTTAAATSASSATTDLPAAAVESTTVAADPTTAAGDSTTEDRDDASVDSSTALRGVSLAVAGAFGALAVGAWRRRRR